WQGLRSDLSEEQLGCTQGNKALGYLALDVSGKLFGDVFLFHPHPELCDGPERIDVHGLRVRSGLSKVCGIIVVVLTRLSELVRQLFALPVLRPRYPDADVRNGLVIDRQPRPDRCDDQWSALLEYAEMPGWRVHQKRTIVKLPPGRRDEVVRI